MDVSQEYFDLVLRNILRQYTGEQLLDIPGVYEIIAEEFNNDVIDTINKEREVS